MFVHLITHEWTVSHTFLCDLNYMGFRKIKCSEEQPPGHPSLSVHTDKSTAFVAATLVNISCKIFSQWTYYVYSCVHMN